MNRNLMLILYLTHLSWQKNCQRLKKDNISRNSFHGWDTVLNLTENHSLFWPVCVVYVVYEVCVVFVVCVVCVVYVVYLVCVVCSVCSVCSVCAYSVLSVYLVFVRCIQNICTSNTCWLQKKHMQTPQKQV